MKTDLFQSCSHCWVFQIWWHMECSTLTVSFFRVWNRSAGIPSPPLALFIVMLPKPHWLQTLGCLTLSEWSHHRGYLGHKDHFLHSSSRYSCHLFLISSASVRSIPFLSFIVPIFTWSSFGISNFLEEMSSLSQSIIFSISFHWSLRKAFLSFFPCFSLEHALKWVYLSFSPLPLISLLFSAICNASLDSSFASFHIFFLRMVLITAFCTMSRTSVHSYSGIMSIIPNPLNLFVTSNV